MHKNILRAYLYGGRDTPGTLATRYVPQDTLVTRLYENIEAIIIDITRVFNLGITFCVVHHDEATVNHSVYSQ